MTKYSLFCVLILLIALELIAGYMIIPTLIIANNTSFCSNSCNNNPIPVILNIPIAWSQICAKSILFLMVSMVVFNINRGRG